MRKTKFFTCYKCGATIPDYLTFGVGEYEKYCLDHIPWTIRLKMWIKERIGR